METVISCSLTADHSSLIVLYYIRKLSSKINLSPFVSLKTEKKERKKLETSAGL